MVLNIPTIIDFGLIIAFFVIGIYIAKFEFNADYRVAFLIFFAFMLLASVTDAINDNWTYVLLILFPMLVYILFRKPESENVA